MQCGEREAIVFIRRSGGGSGGCDVVLCEACANRRGIIAGKGGLELNIDDLIGSSIEPDPSRSGPVKCPCCGLELEQLRREGRLGCSACSDAFSDEMAKALGRRPALDLESDLLAFGGASGARAAAPEAELRGLRLDLEEALRREEYERAAEIRDALSSRGCGSEQLAKAAAAHDFPFDPLATDGESGPDDDVVLSCSARINRNIEGIPFPGSPRGSSAPARALIRERLLSYGSWSSRSMGELGQAMRRSLSERGIVPRSYAADDEAPILSAPAERLYALLDEGDHLRLRSILPGLDLAAAVGPALALAVRLGGDLGFARRPGFGWICSRLADCGLACSLSATIHLPALTAAGMRDRLFRALMSEGLSVRGFYSSSEDSAGSVYEIGIEAAGAGSVAALARAFSAAAAKAVAAERRARAEISERGRGALVDAEGRAFGITRYFGLSGTEEAASLLSVLRLASLRGSLAAADHRSLGALLAALGSGSVSIAAGLRDIPSAASLDTRRALLVKNALAGAEYRTEEGA